MKYWELFLVTYFIFFVQLFAQAPVIEWTKTYGGIENEYLSSVYQTLDGGYIIGGSTFSFGAGLHDPFLLKTDNQGDSLWLQTYGVSHLSENIECFQKTNDGGYIMVGNSGSSSNDSQIYLLKIRSNYELEWEVYHGADSLDEICRWVEQTNDSNYVTTGYYWAPSTQNDFFLIIYNQVGLGLLVRKFSWDYTDQSNCVKQTNDGGFVITGSTASWNTLHDKDVFLQKIDADGNSVWTQTYGGSADEEGIYVHQTLDGGFIIVGYTESFSAVMRDIYIIRTDTIGNLIWTKLYGGIFNDASNYVLETIDGNYIIIGSLSWDAFAMKIDINGDSLWSMRWGGPQSESAYSIQPTTDGGYIIGGVTTSYSAGGADIYITKLSSEPSRFDNPSGECTPERLTLLQNYPNPFNPLTTIEYQIPELSIVTLKIYDVLGNTIKTLVNEEKQAGSHEIKWYAENLPSGVYFYRLQAGYPSTSSGQSFVETKRMLLMK